MPIYTLQIQKGFYYPNFLILEMRKQRPRKVEYLVQDHTDDKWSITASRLNPSLSEAGYLECILFPRLILPCCRDVILPQSRLTNYKQWRHSWGYTQNLRRGCHQNSLSPPPILLVSSLHTLKFFINMRLKRWPSATRRLRSSPFRDQRSSLLCPAPAFHIPSPHSPTHSSI